MRLNRYLIEQRPTPGQKVIEHIRRDVSSVYLNALSKAGEFVYRGTDNTIDFIDEFPVRKDRRPFSTDYREHEMIDKMFEKEFGWKVRSNSVFATSNEFDADTYGRPYLFFPVGKFKYVWSPKVRDLWGTLGATKREIVTKEKIGDTSKRPHLARDTWFKNVWIEGGGLEKEFPKILQYYTDRQLTAAIKKGVEIAFTCKTYYLVNRGFEDQLAGEFL